MLSSKSNRGSSAPTPAGPRLFGTDSFYTSMSVDYSSSPGSSPRHHPRVRENVVSHPSSPQPFVVQDAIPIAESVSAPHIDTLPAASEEKDLDPKEMVQRLCEMGFKAEAAKVALELSENNLASAAAYLVADAKASAENDSSRSSTATTSASTKASSGKLGLPRMLLGAGSGKSGKQVSTKLT